MTSYPALKKKEIASPGAMEARPGSSVYPGLNRAESPALEVEDLSVTFVQYGRGLRRENLKVITGLDVSVSPGEVLAVVGSSGSGKSLLAHAVLGILPGNALVTGAMHYAGAPLTPKRQASLRGREIVLVPQSVSYLNPLMRVGRNVRHAVKEGNAVEAQRKVFSRYHLEQQVERLFPFQLSGGMARRVLVAGAAVSRARLVIADEPTPGLHPAAARETLAHLRELADEGCAVMLITHDINAALIISNRIAVFYAGTTLEIAPVNDFSENGEALRHPYSKALWRALPSNGFQPLPGFQPSPNDLPPGCLFAPRCPRADSECLSMRPRFREIRGGKVRCFHGS